MRERRGFVRALHISIFAEAAADTRHVDRWIYFSPCHDLYRARGRCGKFLRKPHISRGAPFRKRHRIND